MTSGPVLAKAGDLAAILTNLEARDVLFIDEIHRLNPAVEEVLYPALEDFELDLVIGEGPAARTMRIELQPFTLVGATTRMGLLTTPLRDRFGIPTRLQFYTEDELFIIVERNARKLGAPADEAGAREIAKRARGTPRIAGRLLRRVVPGLPLPLRDPCCHVLHHRHRAAHPGEFKLFTVTFCANPANNLTCLIYLSRPSLRTCS